METQQFNQALSIIWNNNFPEAKGFSSLEVDKLLLRKLLTLFELGNSYYFVANMPETRFEYISPELEKVLGYKPNEMTMELGFSKVHPEDRAFMVNVEYTIINFFSNLPIEKIFKYKVRYDYRIQRKDESYARMLHQALILSHAENGALSQALGVQSDITYLKTNSHPCLSFIGLDGEPDFIDVPIINFEHPEHKKFFTKRECEILSLLWEGKESAEIGRQLFISKFTVDTHRRRMLNRSNCTNTIELIRYALALGEI